MPRKYTIGEVKKMHGLDMAMSYDFEDVDWFIDYISKLNRIAYDLTQENKELKELLEPKGE